MPHQSIYAIAVSEGQALQIEEKLTKAGFTNDEISALIPDKDGGLYQEMEVARENPRAGTATGGVLGSALDLIASIGALAIPGVGRLIAAGPLLTTLSAVIAGAAAVGLGSALAALGLSETAAKHYENRITGGDILISVQTQSAEQVEKAKEVLESAHAEDIAVTVTPESLS